MKIEKTKLVREGDKKPSDRMKELVLEKAKEVKLSVPFKADGFISEKNPTQPDGVTPIVVEKAGLNIKVEQEKKEVPKEVEPVKKPKKTKTKKK